MSEQLPIDLLTYMSIEDTTPIRRLTIYQHILAKAESHRISPDLRVHVDRAIEVDQEAASLWDKVKNNKDAPVGTRQIDAEVDASVGGIFNVANAMRLGSIEGSEKYEAAARLLEKGFPNGVRAITDLPYQQQHRMVTRLIHSLRSKLAPQANMLGLGDMVDRLDAANTKYGAALSNTNASGNLRALALERDKEGQVMLAQTLIRVLAENLGAGDDARARSHLLKAFHDDQEEARALKARGRSTPGLLSAVD